MEAAAPVNEHSDVICIIMELMKGDFDSLPICYGVVSSVMDGRRQAKGTNRVGFHAGSGMVHMLLVAVRSSCLF